MVRFGVSNRSSPKFGVGGTANVSDVASICVKLCRKLEIALIWFCFCQNLPCPIFEFLPILHLCNVAAPFFVS